MSIGYVFGVRLFIPTLMYTLMRVCFFATNSNIIMACLMVCMYRLASFYAKPCCCFCQNFLVAPFAGAINASLVPCHLCTQAYRQ